ncbi:MAG: hypothetical protein A3F18_05645 [Legionellales bacterium RIFCSPHIGHO2_12_FULL_37_14]|nr:MAG: hypothetical protein A3F18_05645 [Legionellales bacterium RIFCSPHIGHO2_12_FULL_37_14]
MTQEAKTICVPDIGGVSGVDVIEILVKQGDEIELNQALMTLESDKATVDIPAPVKGKVLELLVKVGDKVSEGTPILKVVASEGKDAAKPKPEKVDQAPKDTPKEKPQVQEESEPLNDEAKSKDTTYASPGVRRLARELDINLAAIKGSGRKGRITRDDLLATIKRNMQQGVSSAWPSMVTALSDDFTQFGKVEVKPLNKIKRLTAEYMHKAWLTVPHVTQFDEANITELEEFRKAHLQESKDRGYKLTILAFVVKALTRALALHPQFNASLAKGGQELIYKHYFNIGIAVDTPNGLMVPVVKNADALSVSAIAQEMQRLSTVAREKGLLPGDLKGSTFTVSSLGGIGGTQFTPIVNAPEVAILGLSRAQIKPYYAGQAFIPQLMLPLALSYDHRVIDGAEAARFMRDLAALISDIRGILL